MEVLCVYFWFYLPLFLTILVQLAQSSLRTGSYEYLVQLEVLICRYNGKVGELGRKIISFDNFVSFVAANELMSHFPGVVVL